MNKKVSLLIAISILVTTVFSIPTFAATANPTASTVLVDGNNVAFDAYNIADNNYFKLRDLTFTLSGTAKQFEVGWDGANNAISLASGQSYTVAGGEMTGKGGGTKEATPTDSRIILNGREVQFAAYNIDGNNYFKHRDIGEAFDFGVDWDGDRNTIVVDTSKGYSLDGATTTPVSKPTPAPTPTPTPEPTHPSSGNTDSKLVGFWVRSIGTSDYRYYLSFKDDGSYSYVQISGSTTTTVTGKYTTSNSRVYLTGLIDDMNRMLKDQNMGYSFGTDSDGEYLSIATVWFAEVGTDNEVEEMSPTQFWRSN